MVLQNYPLSGIARPGAGALTRNMPMSWFYDRVHCPGSNLLQEISQGPVAAVAGGTS